MNRHLAVPLVAVAAVVTFAAGAAASPSINAVCPQEPCRAGLTIAAPSAPLPDPIADRARPNPAAQRFLATAWTTAAPAMQVANAAWFLVS
jgi:hypothetical protein